MIFKNVYESPEFQVITLDMQDVITTSFVSQEEFDDKASWNEKWNNI